MHIEILKEAKSDLFRAAYFYESQASELGDYFFDSIITDIESLQLYVGIHVKVNGYYRLLAKRFPYAIYYKYTKTTIKIYAILDCRSNPNKIEKKLT
jgi:hypothetical protein